MRKRDILILAGAMLLSLALTVWVLVSAVVETGSWGLSFQTEGQAPAGPLDSRPPERLGGAYVGKSDEKVL